MAKPARRPGRPKKPDGEKLEQFSIRLPPKLKFGLELLARAQHRSLSQAVEWALNVGLNNYTVSSAYSERTETIGSVVDEAWAEEYASERALAIYRVNPVLLSFEDAKACELVETSSERELIFESVDSVTGNEARSEISRRHELYYKFVSLSWAQLKEEAVDRAQAGKPLTGLSIFRVLGIMSLLDNRDYFSSMDSIIKCELSDNPKEAFDKYAEHLEKSMRVNMREALAEIGIFRASVSTAPPP